MGKAVRPAEIFPARKRFGSGHMKYTSNVAADMDGTWMIGCKRSVSRPTNLQPVRSVLTTAIRGPHIGAE